MARDSITRTGARTRGVERRRSLAWRCSTEQVVSGSERRLHAATESTKDGGKLDLATGMLGAVRPWLAHWYFRPRVSYLYPDRGDSALFLGNMGSIQRETRPSMQREDQPTMETKLERIAAKCCESPVEERSAGNPHATFCGSCAVQSALN